ncbi:hypothetical protein P9112_011554 [Eukaryota sp. TZLM1-RC]
MIIGVPKEIKNNESRVACTPAGAREFVKNGHMVYVQHTAGINSGFEDAEYEKAGAKILPTIEDVYAIAEMIIKVKEPLEEEYALIREGTLVFTFFHFAASETLTKAMIKSKATCLAYETVQQGNALPLLIPMSEVAGRASVQFGARFLQKTEGGKGKLLGGVPGVEPANVVILGGGIAGTNAAMMAAGLGAQVTIVDISLPRLRYLDEVMPKNVKTCYSNEVNIRRLSKTADLIIGAVLIPGAEAPKLMTRDMLKDMEEGSVIIDIAIDQGGCIETCDHATTHSDPSYVVDGIVHSCVANLPGAFPQTSTLALTNVTLPYALQLANKGWKKACQENAELCKGLNIVNGEVVYKAVADTFDLSCVDVNKFLTECNE